MTTFKPGDKVTSPLLVGEWEVIGYDYADDLWVWLANGKERIRESRYRLTLVAPPLPPEPPVGTVVFCPNDGDPADGGWFATMRFDGYTKPWVDAWGNSADWADIAADARPAVPKPTVEQMMKALHNTGDEVDRNVAADLIARLWPEEDGHE